MISNRISPTTLQELPLKKKTLILADLHLEENAAGTEKFLNLLQQNIPPDSLVLILGDLFPFWTSREFDPEIGLTPWERNTFRFQQKILKAIALYKKKGGSIILVQGNRDFLFRSKTQQEQKIKTFGWEKCFDQVVPNFCRLKTEENSVFLFHHGDIANPKDRGYFLLRWFVRHPLLRKVLFAIPEKYANLWVYKLKNLFYEKVTPVPKFFPQLAWEKWAQKQMKQWQADYFLIGHFHPQKMVQKKLSYGKLAIVLPAWFVHFHYYEVQSSGAHSLKIWKE